MYKLPARTTVNGTLQFTSQNQNDDLIDWTINPLIDSPTVFASFPHLAQLPRPTAEAEAQGINALINLSSRPFRSGTFTVRYRYNERDVKTPTFDATEYVRFDAVPEEVEEGLSPQFDTSRHLLDANVAFDADVHGAPFASATATRASSDAAVASATSARTSSGPRSTPTRASTSPCAPPSTWAGAAAKGSSKPESTTRRARAARSRRCVTTTNPTATGSGARSS